MLTFLVRENAYISNLTMHHTLWKLDFRCPKDTIAIVRAGMF